MLGVGIRVHVSIRVRYWSPRVEFFYRAACNADAV